MIAAARVALDRCLRAIEDLRAHLSSSPSDQEETRLRLSEFGDELRFALDDLLKAVPEKTGDCNLRGRRRHFAWYSVASHKGVSART